MATMPNYMIDVQTPFQAALQGYQAGAMMRDDQQQQQQQALARQQQIQTQKDLAALANNANATPQDYAAMTLKYPALKDAIKQSSTFTSEAQKANTLKSGTQVYAALSNSQPAIAQQLLDQRAAAMRASGDAKGAQDAENMSKIIGVNPAMARNMLGLNLAALDDKFIPSVTGLGTEQRAAEQAPADLAKKNAEAGIKTAEAGVAPQKNALDIANAAEDVETKQSQRQIAALNTQISQANSETQRGELILKRDELVQKQADKTKLEGAGAQDTIDTLNQTRATVDALMKHPGLNGGTVLGGAGTVTGRMLGGVPGTDDKDFRAQIETLQAQNFQSQIKSMVGLGALSDAEGKKLSAAIANLDPDQSAKQLKNNLGVVRGYLDKAVAKQVGGGKLPTAGGGFVLKHPVYGNVTEGTINQLMTKFPGSTRDQVMQYLNSTAAPRGGATGSF